ncbi:unnamed protein product [Leuciscus chuanchicus]
MEVCKEGRVQEVFGEKRSQMHRGFKRKRRILDPRHRRIKSCRYLFGLSRSPFDYFQRLMPSCAGPSAEDSLWHYGQFSGKTPSATLSQNGRALPHLIGKNYLQSSPMTKCTLGFQWNGGWGNDTTAEN